MNRKKHDFSQKRIKEMGFQSGKTIPNTHVIVGFTPFHSLFVEKLIESLDGEIFCLFTKRWPRNNKSYSRLGFFSRKRRFFYKISYLLSFLYFTFRIRYFFLEGRKVHIYIPHPSNIFSNFLFFDKRVISVNIYEDGVLNYYDIEASGNEVGLGLKLFSALCGVKYRTYRGHLAGYDARKVKNLYVTRENEIVGRDKIESIIQVQSAEMSIETVTGRVLFLDQDVSATITAGRKKTLIAKMFEIYSPLKYHYIYKGHHDFDRSISGMFLLQDKLSQLPAEMIISELRPEMVVSFFSSALLNISLAYPNVKCLALAAEGVSIQRDGVPGSLGDIFSANGVQCLPFE